MFCMTDNADNFRINAPLLARVLEHVPRRSDCNPPFGTLRCEYICRDVFKVHFEDLVAHPGVFLGSAMPLSRKSRSMIFLYY